jgi:hypothetical protein
LEWCRYSISCQLYLAQVYQGPQILHELLFWWSVCQDDKTQPKCVWTMDQGQSVLVCNMILWLLYFCKLYSNIMIAPCYPESVANEVISTVSGVRFIKWAQDPLVSFVKCEAPSILLHSGDKRYSAFKDVLSPIWCFSIVIVNLKWHLRPRVMLEDPTSQPLKNSLTLKGKIFLHNKRQ